MDLSIFNALIGTTDTQNPFGVMPTPDNNSTTEDTSVGTRDGFLQCLEQARLGNMNLSSDSLFTSLQAKTQTTKLTKNLKTNLKSGTKVVKLRMEIKRPETPKTEVVQQPQQIQQPVQTKQAVTPQTQEVQQPQQIDEEVVVEATDQLVAENTEQVEVQTEPTENLTPVQIEKPELTTEQPVQMTSAPKKEQVIENKAEVKTNTPEKIVLSNNDTPVEMTVEKPELESKQLEQVITKKAEKIEVNEDQVLPVLQVSQTEIPVHIEKQQAIQTKEQKAEFIPTENTPVEENELPQIQMTASKKTFEAPKIQQEAPQAQLPEQIDLGEENYESTSELKMYSGFDLPDEQVVQQQQSLASILPEGTHAKISVSVKEYGKKDTKTEVVPETKKAVKPVETNDQSDLADNSFTPSEHKAKDSALAKNIFSRPSFNELKSEKTENNFQPLFSLASTEQNVSEDLAPLTFKSGSGIQNISSTSSMPTFGLNEGSKDIKTPVKAQQTTPTPKYTPVNELTDQIKVKITKALAQNTGKIDVSITTKELGKVQVSVETKDGQTTVKINASRPETLTLLQNDIAVLKQSLSDLGMNMGNSSFFFNYKQENQQKESENKNLAHNLQNDSTDEIAEVSEVQNEYITKDRVNVRI